MIQCLSRSEGCLKEMHYRYRSCIGSRNWGNALASARNGPSLRSVVAYLPSQLHLPLLSQIRHVFFHPSLEEKDTSSFHVFWNNNAFHGTMIAATRRWFRRNRTNLAIGAGVIGAGYLAGQYVLGKIQEARQRMTEERISKEKYARHLSRHCAQRSANRLAVFAAASSRTRKTVPTRSWHSSLRYERRYWRSYLSNRSQKSYSARDKSD